MDLMALHERIRIDSPLYARRTVQRILDRVEFLGEHPMIGHPVREYNDRMIREVQVGDQRIIHKAGAVQVQILRIFHVKRLLGRRNLP